MIPLRIINTIWK